MKIIIFVLCAYLLCVGSSCSDRFAAKNKENSVATIGEESSIVITEVIITTDIYIPNVYVYYDKKTGIEYLVFHRNGVVIRGEKK